MTNRTAAMRYARALLDVSQKDASSERVERELIGFVDLMATYPVLGDSLMDPRLPPARKIALMTELIPKLGGLSDITCRLLMLLAERDRLAILGEILEVYHDRLMDLKGIVRAVITTASPLSPERLQGIVQTLKTVTGKQVEIGTDVDGTLVGGMVARIGSTVYDGSIARHLERLRRRLLAPA